MCFHLANFGLFKPVHSRNQARHRQTDIQTDRRGGHNKSLALMVSACPLCTMSHAVPVCEWPMLSSASSICSAVVSYCCWLKQSPTRHWLGHRWWNWLDASACYIHIGTLESMKSPLCCFYVDVEWSSTGDVGDSADEDVHDTIFEWLWGRQWPPSIQVWQLPEFWTASVYSAGLCMLVVASDSKRLAGIPNSSLVQTSAEEADWTWINAVYLHHLHIYIFILDLILENKVVKYLLFVGLLFANQVLLSATE